MPPKKKACTGVGDADQPAGQTVLKEAVAELAEQIPVTSACAALDFPRSTFYWLRQPAMLPVAVPKRYSSRGLTAAERETVRDTLSSERFCDSSPQQVYATLLDEGVYQCHWRTMHWILDQYGEIRERPNQLRHPTYQKPELLATGLKVALEADEYLARLDGQLPGEKHHIDASAGCGKE